MREHGALLAARCGRGCSANASLDRSVQRADDHVGEAGEGLAGLLRRHRAGQDARADQEHLLLAEQADAVEEILVEARPGRASAASPASSLLGVRQGAEEGRVDQRVHHLRMMRDDVGEPRRGAEQQRDQGEQIGILAQQREQPGAAVQAGEEAVEGGERGIRVLGARELVEQQRHQLGEMLPRRFGLQAAMARRRASARTVAETSSGLRKPMARSCVERLAVVGSAVKTRPRCSAARVGASSNRRA